MYETVRQSRIAALTAGPTARASSASSTTSSSSTDYHSPTPKRTHHVANALTVPPPSTRSAAAKAEQDDDEPQPFLPNEHSPDATTSTRLLLATSQTVYNHYQVQLKHTMACRLATRACMNIAQDVSVRHADLLRHSGELSVAADRLQEQQLVLTKHATDIGRPLVHYDSVDRVGMLVGVLFKGQQTVRGLAKIKVDADEFPIVLEDIDKAVVYFGREVGGKQVLDAELKKSKQQKQQQDQTTTLTSGNMEYYRRALALQEAALDLIREAVLDRITTTTEQVCGALSLNSKTVPADQLEASLIYTRFHGISSRSNRLLGLLKARWTATNDDVYLDLLRKCRVAYTHARDTMLKLTVRGHLDKLKEQHGAVGMTRLASVFLIRLCTVETALYVDFFGEPKTNPSDETTTTSEAKPPRRTSSQKNPTASDTSFKDQEFQAYLISLCTALHRTVRRSLVTMNDLDTLCQIVSVLREERSMASSSPVTMAAARAISSVIEDAQERLIFCANTTLTKEVIKFKPSVSDLEYPDKLRKKQEASTTTNDADDMEQQLLQVYESWFPPLRTVLKILSKIFRVVEPKVFEDMALTSVQSCVTCLRNGAESIESRSGEMHSDLFLVKHLLILREQLSPFDIELRSVERQLDFSDAGKAVARFLANRNRRVFSMSAENALVTLLREGVSVQEASVDSKRDLEDALRSACNAFIDHTSRSIAKDLLSAVEAYKVSDSAKSLADDPLSSALSVLDMLTKMSDTIETAFGDVSSQMALYLDNPATQSILLKPVSRKITRALEDVRKIMTQMPDGTNGWDSKSKTQVGDICTSLEEVVKAAARVSK